jgi:hypothetical protein
MNSGSYKSTNITITSSNNLTTTGTVCAWAYITTANYNGIYNHGTNNGGNGGCALYIGVSGAITLDVGGADYASKRMTGGAVPLGQWNYLCGKWDGSYLYTYLNGIQSGTATAQNGSALYLVLANGDRIGTSPSLSVGAPYIDEVAIWNRSLSASEIQQLYLNTKQGRTAPINFTIQTTTTNVLPVGILNSNSNKFYTPFLKGVANVGGYLDTFYVAGAPTVSLTSPVNGSFVASNQTFAANFSLSSGLSNATLYLWNSTGGLIGTNSSLISGTANSTNLSIAFPYSDIFYWNYLAYGTNGLSAWALSNWSMGYDPTGATMNYNSPTLDSGSYRNISNVEVNVSAVHSNLANITVNLYDGSMTLLQTNVSNSSPYYISYSGLSNGVYYYNSSSFTTFGVNSSLETRNITIDSIAPNATLINAPIGYSSNPSQNFSIFLSDLFGLSNVTLFIYDNLGVLYNQTTVALNGALTATVGVVVNLVDGAYTWFFRVIDLAGNMNQSETNNITIDTIPPTITIYSPAEERYNGVEQIWVNFTSSDSSGVSARWFNYNGTNISYSSPVNVSVSQGNYTFVFYSNDSVGNIGVSSVSVENLALGTLNVLLVSPTGTGNKQPQNQSFFLIANVTCSGSVGAICGSVGGAVRYNVSGVDPDTNIQGGNISTMPFYTIESNPRSCGNMNVGDVCSLNWTVYATGEIGKSYKLNVNFDSDNLGVDSNVTASMGLSIINPTLSITLSPELTNVNFGSSLNPATANNPALGDSSNSYTITCNYEPGSCNVSMAANNHLISGINTIGIGNITWASQNNPNSGAQMSLNYSVVNGSLFDNATQPVYFWLNVPGGQIAGDYKSNFTILGQPS